MFKWVVSKLNIASHNGITGGLESNGVFVKSTAEELNKLTELLQMVL